MLGDSRKHLLLGHVTPKWSRVDADGPPTDPVHGLVEVDGPVPPLFEMKPGEIRGMAILPGGQIEQPGSAHHNDQLAEFTNETYRTLRFYPDEVAEGLEETWSLPAGFPLTGTITIE